MKDILKFIIFGGLFVIPFLALYVENDFFFPYITGKNFGFRIITECVFGAWVLLALYDAQYRPRFSWIFASFFAFLLVMFVANVHGESPRDSFWSNFERMEGYVTLVHVFLYLVVMGSVFTTEKMWFRYFNTTLIAASILSFHALGQISGLIEHRYGGFRVDATLGNATYMAIYMFFHTYIAGYMLLRAKTNGRKYMYGALMLIFAYLLIQTATRGTTIGLVIGVIVSVLYIALFTKESPRVRKGALGVLLGIVLLVGGFAAVRDKEFVQNNPTLTRLASISLEQGTNRFNIWGMAFQGVKERPLLGWGQGNYNYVFNKYYRPELHGGEAWFDRVHNIVMDWLIAGGVFGLIAYFSVLFSALYYLFLVPLLKKEDQVFSVVERGVLIGLLAGYTTHNMFVFDNIVSYIFYGLFLAYIHSRVAHRIPSLEKLKIHTRIIDQVAVPVMGVLVVLCVYFTNIPGIQAAGDIIDAFRTQDAETMLGYFETALARDSFGVQEVREQMTQKVQDIIRIPQVPEDTKQKAFKRVEAELLKQAEEKPGDARVHVFISSFYRTTNNFDQAIEQIEIARSLSPRKQLIIFEQGMAHIQKGEYQKALDILKEPYDLGPQFQDSRILYATAAVYNNRLDLLDELIQTDADKRAFAENQLAVQAVYGAKLYTRLIDMFTLQVETKPDDSQLRTNLAFVLNETGDIDGAIAVLKKAGEDIPVFKEQADGFIASLEQEKLKKKVPSVIKR
jgi:O-antigen ligase/tetratricopeptide (TPR) repeat protein